MARPRKPTSLKLIKGTARKCRLNPAEPKPVREIPSPPAHLSDRARTVWGAVAMILDEMAVITRADGLALEALCECYAELVEARAALKARGASNYSCYTEGGSEMWRPYPEVAQISDADRRLCTWLAKFGMTAADRSRVSRLASDKNENPFSQFAKS